MTSEELGATGPGPGRPPQATGAAGERSPAEHDGRHETGDLTETGDAGDLGEAGGVRADGQRLNLTDPKAIRALAHPVRWALLEALGHAGTLTATQASEMLGESPANCAFHLRTLGKYGFVEEAGGGRGRERPWRRSYDSMSWHESREDSPVSQATAALDQVWLDRSLARARRGLTSISQWPPGLEEVLGGTTRRLYLTPEETAELGTELRETFERLLGPSRFKERRDPKRRPAGAVPIDFILFGYPVLDLPPLPGQVTDDTDDLDYTDAVDDQANPSEA